MPSAARYALPSYSGSVPRRGSGGAPSVATSPRGDASACPYAVACASARNARSGERSTGTPCARNAAMNSGGTGKSSPSTAMTAGLPPARSVGSKACTLSIA